MAGKNLDRHGVNWLKSRQVKRDSRTGEGSTLLNFENDFTDHDVLLESKNEIETFIISGLFENQSGDKLQERAHSYKKSSAVQLPLRAIKSGRILVSHGVDLKVTTA